MSPQETGTLIAAAALALVAVSAGLAAGVRKGDTEATHFANVTDDEAAM